MSKCVYSTILERHLIQVGIRVQSALACLLRRSYLERVLLKVVDLDVGVDVNVDFTTKVTHTYVAFYEGA